MDYPRDYIVIDNKINYKTAFIIMPMNDKYDYVYGIIKDVCERLNIKAERADDIIQQNFIMSNVLEGIVKSETVIVDISEGNPNVFYELGIAHSLKPRQNVIIIQSEDYCFEKTPIDIIHWTIIKYKKNNWSLFKAQLSERLETNMMIINEEDYIKQLLIAHTHDKDIINKFIKQLVTTNFNYLRYIAVILQNRKDFNEEQIVEKLNSYLTIVSDYEGNKFAKLCWLIKYLVFTSDIILNEYFEEIEKIFLITWKRDSINMSDTDYWDLCSKICFSIINKNHIKKCIAIKWLTNYLKNTRMGRIDKVRTMIEDYLLTVPDQDVDIAVSKLIQGNSRTAKESAIDIVGQKPIYYAVDSLINIINNDEPDPHIVRSCINALTRMKIVSAAPLIVKWMSNNQDKWGNQAVSASLKNVAQNALEVLDPSYCKEFIDLYT